MNDHHPSQPTIQQPLFCDACKHVVDIDDEAIAAKYGRGVMLTEIGAKTRCNECDGLGSSVQVLAVE